MTSDEAPLLHGLRLEGPVDAWRRLGLDVRPDATSAVGDVALRCDAAPGDGLAGWDVTGLAGAALLPTATVRADGTAVHDHPLGAVAVDHVVVTTGDVDRTLGQLGATPRRRVDLPDRRMAFVLLGSSLLELVGPAEPDDGPARFWGLVLVVDDLDVAVAALGGACGPAREAVQPGRRIATVRAEALGLTVPLALMTPRA